METNNGGIGDCLGSAAADGRTNNLSFGYCLVSAAADRRPIMEAEASALSLLQLILQDNSLHNIRRKYKIITDDMSPKYIFGGNYTQTKIL